MGIVSNAAPSCLLTGTARAEALETIVREHYLHRAPTCASHVFRFREAIIVMARSANPNITRYILGRRSRRPLVWDLARLWAPADHEPNLLTQAISAVVREFREVEPRVEALVSYADLNAGHQGGVYRAASWRPIGATDKVRFYADRRGRYICERPWAREYRLNRRQLARRGWRIVYGQKRLRFAFGLTRQAKSAIEERFAPRSKRQKCWEVVAELLRETGRQRITINDPELLRTIYERMNWTGRNPEYRVLHALTEQPGELVEGRVLGQRGAWAKRLVRSFSIAE